MPKTGPAVASSRSSPGNSAGIPRSASCDQIAIATLSNGSSETHFVKRSHSQNALAFPPGDVLRHSPARQESDIKESALRKQLSIRSSSKPKIAISKYTLATQLEESKVAGDGGFSSGPDIKTRSVSGSLSSFAKKSWHTASRSPSPQPRTALAGSHLATKPTANFSRPSQTFPPGNHEEHSRRLNNGDASHSLNKSFAIGKKSRRPLSAFLGKVSSEPKVPSVPSIPKSFSTDQLMSIPHVHASSDILPTIPKSMSFDRLHVLGVESLRRRDELWSAFRALDGEFHKFQSRPNIAKAGVVRSALLPFLRDNAEHPSNTLLRPEELDRRIQVLNRWWTGLLELLNGKNGECVSGNDRPAILEAAAAIMVRPEWDSPSPTSMARSIMTLRPSLKSRSTTSLGSTASEFLADSVYHNIKHTYAQNLIAQMSYVVDKMSTRNVPTSVVTFCGKAIAYAFFYCDGVAEILVRSWATSAETLRRVLAENDIRRDADLKQASEKIITRFPSCLHGLSFTSLQSMMRYLRSQPQLPIATRCIALHRSWVGRWIGRDTDLFFVFVKSYYSLVGRLLPEDHTQEDRICTPAYALVQAQILTIMDTTMQHTSNQPYLEHTKGSSLLTFDDILGEPDVSATLLPIPTTNMVRSMAENRLIMLLRDFLSGPHSAVEQDREIFAHSFQILLRAATRRISVFDHNACFTLCDFMEEAIVIIDRYCQTSTPQTFKLDWQFWLEVLRKLTESQNTMTEIRLYALLYSLWGTITSEESRKYEICIGWLLQENFFQGQFSHWCPMVRAYFMRLLCWRVARIDGKGSELDRMILKTLALQIERGWCYYLYLKRLGESKGLVAPSTIPCSPAPGRRLLIVQDDLQAISNGMFLSFDNMLLHSLSTQATAYERHSSLNSLTQEGFSSPTQTLEDTARPASMAKRRWGLLKNILPFASGSTDRPQTNLPAPNPSLSKQTPWKGTSQRVSTEDKLRSDRINKKSSQMITGPAQTKPSFRSHSFKFSLEWIDKDYKEVENGLLLQPPKLPVAAQMLLDTVRCETREYGPIKPEGITRGPSKYAGRALAEWSEIIMECQVFFERRRQEGVPMSSKVETPTLGVESFRKF